MRILLTAGIKAGLWGPEASKWDIELICQSSQLHDVGKIAISDSILKKPGMLTYEEFTAMQRHVAHGVGFIEHLEDGEAYSAFLHYAKTFVEFHHEKWDGTGYLRGISGEDIPLFGRLMAIVDVYDALTSERPYKKIFSHEEAVRIIRDGKGKHFDPMLVNLFEEVAEQFK
jgi:putative two-component system response regulator